MLEHDTVKELFNFDFNIMLESKEEEMDDTFTFAKRRNIQRFYLSQNTERLMEVVNNLIAKIY